MSWFPGIVTSGSSNARRNRAARSCWLRRPRCVRSPLATISSGRFCSTRAARARSIAGSSRVPKWRSDTWSTTVGTADGGYTLRRVRDDSAEVFDDLYLGLRAGGARRKQRRGEPLSADEQEALGRWQRLSTWRKTIAVGAFAVGTFGLGFTLGGLIFGRRRAKA